MRRPLSRSFIDTYRRLPRINQEHTIGSFQAELNQLDAKRDEDEIRKMKSIISMLVSLKNSD